MNYRDEKEHDKLLIELIKSLNSIDQLQIFSKYFLKGTNTGKLVRARRRRDFDVELTFENLSCVIETKVDSDEGGRWDKMYQTVAISTDPKKLKNLHNNKFYFFITYGLSEFYIKEGTYKQGPRNDEKFIHIGLLTIIDFVSDAIKVVSSNKEKLEEWLKALNVENNKRNRYKELLEYYSKFKKAYIDIEKSIDLPTHRAVVSLPELAFPLYCELSNLWNNNSKYYNKFGKATVYPIPRNRQIMDSVLNFTELWRRLDKNNLMTCNGLLKCNGQNKLYFEFNEDFNLHLKISDKDFTDDIKQYIHGKKQLSTINGVKGMAVDYLQQVYVIYEWDVGLLDNIYNLDLVLDNTYNVINTAVDCLK